MGEGDARVDMTHGAVGRPAAADSVPPHSSTGAIHPRGHQGKLRVVAVLLRILGWVFSTIALVLVATDKQTTIIPIILPGMSQPIYRAQTASYRNIKAVKFYLGSLAVVVAYTFFQALLSSLYLLTTKTVVRSKTEAWFTFITDQAVAYLLASAAAVATEIGYISKRGATKVGWNELCSPFHHYCTVYGISIINTYLAALPLFASAAVSAYHLFHYYGPLSQGYDTRKATHI